MGCSSSKNLQAKNVAEPSAEIIRARKSAMRDLSEDELMHQGIASAQRASVTKDNQEKIYLLEQARTYLLEALNRQKEATSADPTTAREREPARVHIAAVLLALGEDPGVVKEQVEDALAKSPKLSTAGLRQRQRSSNSLLDLMSINASLVESDLGVQVLDVADLPPHLLVSTDEDGGVVVQQILEALAFASGQSPAVEALRPGETGTDSKKGSPFLAKLMSSPLPEIRLPGSSETRRVPHNGEASSKSSRKSQLKSPLKGNVKKERPSPGRTHIWVQPQGAERGTWRPPVFDSLRSDREKLMTSSYEFKPAQSSGDTFPVLPHLATQQGGSRRSFSSLSLKVVQLREEGSRRKVEDLGPGEDSSAPVAQLLTPLASGTVPQSSQLSDSSECEDEEGIFRLRRSDKDMSMLARRYQNARDQNKDIQLRVCIHNGVSADPMTQFSLSLDSDASAGDLSRLWYTLDRFCQHYASTGGQGGIQKMFWMRLEPEASNPNRRRKLPPSPLMLVEAVEQTDPLVSKLSPIIRLTTIPMTPPKQLPPLKVEGQVLRIARVSPDRLRRDEESSLALQVFTESHLDRTRSYKIALISQWDSGRWFEISDSFFLASSRGLGAVLQNQDPVLQALRAAGDDLYDVYLVVDGTYRSINRKTFNVANDVSDSDSEEEEEEEEEEEMKHAREAPSVGESGEGVCKLQPIDWLDRRRGEVNGNSSRSSKLSLLHPLGRKAGRGEEEGNSTPDSSSGASRSKKTWK